MTTDVEQIMESPEYRELYPKTNFIQKKAEKFKLQSGGVYKSAGVGGPITGGGMLFGIIDDPTKNLKEALSNATRKEVEGWYASTFHTRLDDSEGGILITATRWVSNDLIGMVLDTAKNDVQADQWEVVEFPALNEEGDALWPERFNEDALANKRATLGEAVFSAMYMCSPIVEGGGIIKDHWWERFSELPKIPDMNFHSWDTGYKEKDVNDPSAFGHWITEGQDIFLTDVYVERLSYPRLKVKVKELYERDKPDFILIEDKASGQSLIQDLKAEGFPVVATEPDGDKVYRAHVVSPMAEAGRVKLPYSAPWLNAFLKEWREFPGSKFKDQVDMTTQALQYIRERTYTNDIDVMPMGTSVAAQGAI
jgi:predicted phage terminase large subunit-like protein